MGLREEEVEARFRLRKARKKARGRVNVGSEGREAGEGEKTRDSPGSLAGSLSLSMTAKRGKWLKNARDISSAE